MSNTQTPGIYWGVEDRLANLLGVTALAATDRLRTAVEGELSHGGSSPAVLVHLQAYPGESVEAVRRVLGISQPATVRVVDRLAAEGLVERRPGPDRRSLALHLTAVGERAASAALGRRTRSLRALLDALAPAEQAALVPLLERLVASLADDRPQALRVCRLCDRHACTEAPGCPLDHTTQIAR
ncbi:MAG: MarR family winged helix-turn-helix transcriptional regulator [Thermoleophilaceae bacterium]